MSKQYINIFINDRTYGVETDAFYEKIESIKADKPFAPPFLSNNRFTPKEDIIIRKGETVDVTLWFNERDGKRNASICIKPAEDNSDYIKAKKGAREAEAIINDEDIPF
tara:strand:+ start:378 stop:704 length:327 start_codon:yes stop_codon:yes gene_type:complete